MKVSELRSMVLNKMAAGGVFLALVMIGLWGHRTHWDFSGLFNSSHGENPKLERLPLVKDPVVPANAVSPRQIKLSSPKIIEQLGIKVVDVQNQRLSREIEAAAHVAYFQSRLAQLTSRVAGTVWRAEKRVGQPVTRGEPLAIIDSMQVGQAKARLLRNIAEVGLRQKVLNRLKSLKGGDIPLKHIEQAEAELRKARFDLFDSEQALINLGFPVDSDKLNNLADEELLAYVQFLGLPEPLARTLDPKTSTANLLPLFAPFDGVVIGQDMVTGEVVAPLEGGFEIADISKMQIRLSVREEDSHQLRLGQKVTFDAGDSELSTVISWISTEVDRKTRTIKARCDIDNPYVLDESGRPLEQRLLRANMFGTARIRVEEKPTAIVVPTTAVQWTGNKHVVFVQTDKTAFEMRNVDIGIMTDELTELLNGVKLGECVANEGSHVLKSEAMRLWPSGGA